MSEQMWKKAISLLLCVVFVVALAISASAGLLPVKISGSNVNYRSDPGSNYSSYELLQNGDKLNYKEDSGNWCSCDLVSGTLHEYYGYGLAGWVHSDYLVNG